MLESIKQLPQWVTLGLAIPVATLNLWVLSWIFDTAQPLLTILVVANILAFLLDYPVQLLQQRGVARGYGVLIIVVIAIAAVGTFAVTLAPLLLKQLTDLTSRLPSWIDSSGQQLHSFDDWLAAQHLPGDFSGVAKSLSGLLPDELKLLPNQVLGFASSLADSIIEVLLTAVFTLYLLLHGNAFWNGFFARLPERVVQPIRPLLRQQFRNYFLGQVTIATLMGLTLSTLFFLLKIPYWLVFGLGIGVTVLIPFGDFLGIAVVSLLVSLKSVWLGGEVLVIAVLADQVIDNAIAPRILSKLVGLNPVWVLISLLVGAQVGGVIGVLIAVPLAGAIKVILDSLLPISSALLNDVEPPEHQTVIDLSSK
ncbi:MAG: AI-2E family transporter [Thermosynechococcaceae cyanobacterium]